MAKQHHAQLPSLFPNDDDERCGPYTRPKAAVEAKASLDPWRERGPREQDVRVCGFPYTVRDGQLVTSVPAGDEPDDDDQDVARLFYVNGVGPTHLVLDHGQYGTCTCRFFTETWDCEHVEAVARSGWAFFSDDYSQEEADHA